MLTFSAIANMCKLMRNNSPRNSRHHHCRSFFFFEKKCQRERKRNAKPSSFPPILFSKMHFNTLESNLQCGKSLLQRQKELDHLKDVVHDFSTGTSTTCSEMHHRRPQSSITMLGMRWCRQLYKKIKTTVRKCKVTNATKSQTISFSAVVVKPCSVGTKGRDEL